MSCEPTSAARPITASRLPRSATAAAARPGSRAVAIAPMPPSGGHQRGRDRRQRLPSSVIGTASGWIASTEPREGARARPRCRQDEQAARPRRRASRAVATVHAERSAIARAEQRDGRADNAPAARRAADASRVLPPARAAEAPAPRRTPTRVRHGAPRRATPAVATRAGRPAARRPGQTAPSPRRPRRGRPAEARGRPTSTAEQGAGDQQPERGCGRRRSRALRSIGRVWLEPRAPRQWYERPAADPLLYSAGRERSTRRRDVARRLPRRHRRAGRDRRGARRRSPIGSGSARGCSASDRLLERVWGRMDRYHLAWLNVGRDSAPPGSSLDEAGTRRFIAEVASGKLAVLRTMRTAVERQGWTLLSDDPDERGGPVSYPIAPGGLAAVLAHPDDESFGCAGALALAHDAGATTRLLVVTRGEAGTPDGEADPAFGDQREAELICAATRDRPRRGLDPRRLCGRRRGGPALRHAGRRDRRLARRAAAAGGDHLRAARRDRPSRSHRRGQCHALGGRAARRYRASRRTRCT